MISSAGIIVVDIGRHLPVLVRTSPVVSLRPRRHAHHLRSESLSDRTGAHVFLKYEGLGNLIRPVQGPRHDLGGIEGRRSRRRRGRLRVDRQHECIGRGVRGKGRARLRCLGLQGFVALGKLAQALVHGARVVEIEGNFDVALDLDQGDRQVR